MTQEQISEIPASSYSNAKLESIKTSIELMSKQHHVEVLQIIKKYESVTINENRNGVYINLSYLSNELLQELETFISYIKEQEETLSTLEYQKQEYKDNLLENTSPFLTV